MLQRSRPQLVAVPLEGLEFSYPTSVILPANRMLTPSAAAFLQALRRHVESGRP